MKIASFILNLIRELALKNTLFGLNLFKSFNYTADSLFEEFFGDNSYEFLINEHEKKQAPY